MLALGGEMLPRPTSYYSTVLEPALHRKYRHWKAVVKAVTSYTSCVTRKSAAYECTGSPGSAAVWRPKR